MKHFFSKNTSALLAAPLLSTILSVNAIAQPVLGNQYHVRIGSQFTFTDIEDTALIVAPATGANQTWNFSTMQGSFPLTGRVMAPAGGQRAAAFPNATARLNFSFFGQSFDTYFFSVASGMYVAGSGNPDGITRYNSPILHIPTGLSMGQTFSQNYLETTVESGATKYFRNVEVTTYMGYGTVHLPGGNSYPNTVLLKTEYKGYSPTDSTDPGVLADSGTRYFFLAPGIGYPVVQLTIGYSDKGLGFERDVNGSFMSDIIVAAKPRLAATQIGLYPVPARDQVTLRLPATEEASLTARVLDYTGRNIAEVPVTSGRISVAGLEPGAYWVEVQGKKTYRASLIKE